MSADEWSDTEPHTLVVIKVGEPYGPLSTDEFEEYELDHTGCLVEEVTYPGEEPYSQPVCALGRQERQSGLRCSLDYSGLLGNSEEGIFAQFAPLDLLNVSYLDIGDELQASPIGAAGFYAKELEARPAHELHENYRQTNWRDARVFKMMREGDVEGALEDLAKRNRIFAVDEVQDIPAMVRERWAHYRDEGYQAKEIGIINTGLNTTLDTINRAIQRAVAEQSSGLGHLEGIDHRGFIYDDKGFLGRSPPVFAGLLETVEGPAMLSPEGFGSVLGSLAHARQDDNLVNLPSSTTRPDDDSYGRRFAGARCAKTVRRSIKVLSEAGYIRLDRQAGRANVYYVLAPPVIHRSVAESTVTLDSQGNNPGLRALSSLDSPTDEQEPVTRTKERADYPFINDGGARLKPPRPWCDTCDATTKRRLEDGTYSHETCTECAS